MITNIAIKKLHPHPSNPRKDLGDLTELAESIRAKGVLQNLTVVPQTPGYCPSCNTYNGSVGKCVDGHDATERPPCSKWEDAGNFTVIIGHRRLAAAKLAGLTELMCVITDMSDKEQVATMLLENMQRTDLTLQEQARGFQMMMNLGLTAEDIANKTGFSETTVKRRIKLCQFDKEKFNEGCERGATLMDWMELDKVEDPKRREKLIKEIGTSNFKWSLQTALSEEANEKWREETLKLITPWAKKIPDKKEIWKKYSHVAGYRSGNKEKMVEVPSDVDSKEYFYEAAGGFVDIYTPKEVGVDNQPDPEAEERERLRAERVEITKKAYELRREFVSDYQGAKKHQPILLKYLIRFITKSGGYSYSQRSELCKIFGFDKSLADSEFEERLLSASHEKAILAWLTCGGMISDSSTYGYFSWNGAYQESTRLDLLYELIEELGYKISDVEKRLQDGSHELFVAEDEEDAEDEDDEDVEE